MFICLWVFDIFGKQPKIKVVQVAFGANLPIQQWQRMNRKTKGMEHEKYHTQKRINMILR